MKRVALYLRVSSEEQKLDLQRDELTRFVKARDWDLIEVFEEKMTATKGNRPELKKLLTSARQRKIDIIVCWKMDRFFRSLKDLVVTLQELGELGVELVSLKDNLDLSTSQGKLMMHLLGAFAEFEASLIQERVRAGVQAYRKRHGKWGRPKSIDSEAIIQLRNQGLTYRQISQKLSVGHGSVHSVLKKNFFKEDNGTR